MLISLSFNYQKQLLLNEYDLRRVKNIESTHESNNPDFPSTSRFFKRIYLSLLICYLGRTIACAIEVKSSTTGHPISDILVKFSL